MKDGSQLAAGLMVSKSSSMHDSKGASTHDGCAVFSTHFVQNGGLPQVLVIPEHTLLCTQQALQSSPRLLPPVQRAIQTRRRLNTILHALSFCALNKGRPKNYKKKKELKPPASS